MATLLTRPDDSVGTAPSRAGGPDESEGGRSPSLGDRVRWATVCLGFLALTLSQQPGRIVADTKLDLTVNPWGWLDRALTLWEPEGYAGEVQNQAYGYLFPMGPFFGIASSAGIPGWVTQRLWMALLLSLAFLGVVTLARHLRIGTPAAHLVGGLAYALAPRMLMGLGATSIEVLPMALAPWVLVPLVIGSRRGSPRRFAALSGLVVFCVGGVNAVATSAVLPLAVLWLLTRPSGPRKRRLTAWWVASVALATAWWTGPLLLLGRYSPPFLDYIETARITTATTGLLSTLRGTTQWVAYLVNGEGPLWPTGWALVHDVLPIVATVVLAGIGLVGLTRARMPERSWLVLGLLAGLALVTMGHLAPVQGVLAGPLHDLLDGPLAPMRNVHKYDPVLRLPLALGVTYVCGLLFSRLRPDPARAGDTAATVRRSTARVGVVAVALALVATASPAIAGRLSAPTGFEGIPRYWQQTADFLAEDRPSGRALLLPASSTGTYFWGSTSDEPMQALADSEWTVRNAIPLSASAHIRVLDAVEDRISSGRGSAGLAGYLARAGISHLVVRNDLDFGAVGAARTILVEQALRNSPGIAPVARFGPLVPSETSLLGRILDDYLQPSRPAVVVYEVADPAPVAYATPLDEAVSVSGGPDGLLSLEDRGLIAGRPALLADGGTPAPDTALVSDAQLRRERTFGRTGDAVSAGLTATDDGRTDSPERDYTYPGAELSESVVRYEGGTPSASSSASDSDSVAASYPENQPFAALDGDPSTSWRPANRLGEEQPVWWRVDADRPITADAVTVRLAADSPGLTPGRLRITTDAGSTTVALADTTDPQRFPLPAGETSRITIGVPGRTSDVLALAEVEVPGLTVERTVVTPAPTGTAAAYAFDASTPARSGCVTEVTGRLRCSAALVRGAEESGLDRTFTVAGTADYAMTVTAVPRPGAALDALVDALARPDGPLITASSTAVPDPRAGADAAIDGNPRTTWMAAADDARPSLTLRWPEPRTIDRLRLGLLPGTAAAQPTSVSIGSGGLEQDVAVDLDGVATFPPITTDTLTVAFPLRDETSSFNPYTRAVSTLGIGVSELGLTGLSGGGDPDAVVDARCGRGPTVEIDGVAHPTALRTTLADLRALRPVQLALCDGLATGPLSSGEHRFVARSTAAFTVSSATLTRAGAAAAGDADRLDVDVQRWDREDRAVRVAARTEPALLVVPSSVNPGWVASFDGAELETRTVDGWQQGYVLPAGAAGTVTLEFRAGGVYHAALAAGAGAVLVLLAVLLVPARGAGPGPAAAPVAGRRRRAGILLAVALAAGVALVGGVVGLAALAAALGLAAVARSHRQAALAALVAASLGTAGLLYLVASGTAAQTASQVLALLAVAAVVASLWEPASGGRLSGTRWRQRRTGRSTNR